MTIGFLPWGKGFPSLLPLPVKSLKIIRLVGKGLPQVRSGISTFSFWMKAILSFLTCYVYWRPCKGIQTISPVRVTGRRGGDWTPLPGRKTGKTRRTLIRGSVNLFPGAPTEETIREGLSEGVPRKCRRVLNKIPLTTQAKSKSKRHNVAKTVNNGTYLKRRTALSDDGLKSYRCSGQVQ